MQETKDQIQSRYLRGEINRDAYEKLLARWNEFNSPSANEERRKERLRERSQEQARRNSRRISNADVMDLSMGFSRGDYKAR